MSRPGSRIANGKETPAILTHLPAAATLRRGLPVTPVRPPQPGGALLQSRDAIEDEDHILALGKGGPALMCVPLRAGAAQVAHLCSQERPEADGASLAIVPSVPSLDWPASALPSIRRALRANGRLRVAFTGQATTQPAVRRKPPRSLHIWATCADRRDPGERPNPEPASNLGSGSAWSRLAPG